MYSAILLNMMKGIWEGDIEFDSVLVTRNGYIVLDAYSWPRYADATHNLFSCSNSVTSALIGIAKDKGYIKDVNQPLLDFFTQRIAQNLNAGGVSGRHGKIFKI